MTSDMEKTRPAVQMQYHLTPVNLACRDERLTRRC